MELAKRELYGVPQALDRNCSMFVADRRVVLGFKKARLSGSLAYPVSRLEASRLSSLASRSIPEIVSIKENALANFGITDGFIFIWKRIVLSLLSKCSLALMRMFKNEHCV
ncbi:hypothetical protein RRG08_038859 [Elysia crispata]|uniref:Uncharacterized protein n=1 Tax=Elysia crispata TaxID=231223 RepID=A0AAE0YSZ5_9GAST|nr:hypothetical protein RRG08_038859 [Elysia crispata]